MKHLLTMAVALASATVLNATESTDSVRPAHMLRAVEVLGIKNSAGSEQAEASTRISGAQAKTLQVESAHQLGEIAPNFHMPSYGSRMTSSIYVRGIGARMDQPVVGLTIDNVPVLNKDAYDFDLADIESIEILRGAQAVLNGRNSMGGQINIRTLSPMTATGMRAGISYGSGNTVSANAAYYHKLNPQLAMSLSGQFRHTDGFFRNAYDNSRLDHENSGGARWKTVWRPSPRLSFTNTASFATTRQGGYPYASMETGEIAFNDTCSYSRTMFADGLTVAWAGKRVVVTSVTTAQYLSDDMNLDQDFLPLDYFTLRQKRNEWTFTEDLYTRGRRGSYGWLGGVFAFYKDTGMDAPVTFKDAGISRLIEHNRNEVNPDYPIRWDDRRFTLGSDFTLRAGGVAVYHQSSYEIGRWRLEAGLRLDIERSSLSYFSHCSTGYTTYHVLPDGSKEVFSHSPVNIADGGSIAKTFVEFLPQFTVVWQHEAFSPYFNFSKGYKAGGFNTQMFSDVLQGKIMSEMGIAAPYSLEQIVAYEPERSFNYELGFHSTTAGGELGIDGVLFYIDCRNQQMTTFPAGTVTGRVMTNAGRTRSFGAELSLRWNATEDLSFQASYGYANATFRKYNDGRYDYRGKRVPYSPSNTIFAMADWRIPRLGFLGIVPEISADVRGAGDIYWNEANTLKQNLYATANLTVGFRAEEWNVKLWCKNLFNTSYDTFYFMSIGNSFVQRSQPRTFGVTFNMSLR